MLSMLPSFRRSTRYKSDNGSEPRYLAVHEMDDVNLDTHSKDVLFGTELAKKVIGSAKIFDVTYWQLIFRDGHAGEKL